MREYFSRQLMLWKEDTQKSLQEKSLLIVGAGGLGCSVALALSGSGIGKFYIVDFDKVEIHNIHRQIGFGLSDLNSYKAQTLTSLIVSRNPFLDADFFIEDFNSFSKRDIVPDLIIDATDNLQTRVDIDNFAKKHKISWIYGAVEEFSGYVCLFKDSDFSAFKAVDKNVVGIAAPMVMQVASFQANLALRYLANLHTKSDILYFLYFNNLGELECKKYLL